MNISDPRVPLRPTAPSPEERLFPTLTAAQIARIAARGRRRAIAHGDVLVQVGDKVVPFFVLVSGEIQVLRPSDGTETLIVTHRPGQFSGEGNMITGRRALARLRVSEPGEVTAMVLPLRSATDFRSSPFLPIMAKGTREVCAKNNSTSTLCARIRPTSTLAAGVHIGNFVEV